MAKPETESEKKGVRVIEVNVGYSSWYWVHKPDEPNRLHFALHRGLLLVGRKKKNCVGVDLTDRAAGAWVTKASRRQREGVRTAKIGAQEDLEILRLLPNLEALECSALSEKELQRVCQVGMPLRCLYLSWCQGLTDLEPLRELPSLLRLSISDCTNLRDVGAIEDLTQLQKLDIINCDDIWEIDAVAHARKLHRVTLRNCENIHKLAPLAMLGELSHLDLSRNPHVKDLSPLEKLDKLRLLDLSNCLRVRDVSPLQESASLRVLRLFGCNSLHDLRPLYQLPQLHKISLPNNITNDDLLGLCIGFDGLLQMDLRNCDKVSNIEPIERLTSLRKLSLAGCRNVTDVTPLGELKDLVQLDLACCRRLTDLTPLHGLVNLKDLYIDGCSGLDREEIKAFEEARPDCNVHNT